MNKVGIKQFYNTKYDAKNPEFWKSIDMVSGPDKEYVCIGVKASNYFMPKETLSEKGPGGGGWILMAASSACSVQSREWRMNCLRYQTIPSGSTYIPYIHYIYI